MDAVLAAVVDVGMEMALVGFDPLQLSFHRSPLEKRRRCDGRAPGGCWKRLPDGWRRSAGNRKWTDRRIIFGELCAVRVSNPGPAD
jgi:hypothetical protein